MHVGFVCVCVCVCVCVRIRSIEAWGGTSPEIALPCLNILNKTEELYMNYVGFLKCTTAKKMQMSYSHSRSNT